MGKFIIRNVNFFIVFLLFITLGALVGSSLYFQKRFDNISRDYIFALERMKNTTTSLESYQQLYLDAITNLNQTEQDVRQYDELFSTKSREYETTYEELVATKEQLSATKSLLLSTETELDATSKSLDIKSRELTDLKKNNTLLKADYDKLVTDHQKVVAELADCEDDYEELEDDCAP